VVALAGTASGVMRPSQPYVGEKLASLHWFFREN